MDISHPVCLFSPYIMENSSVEKNKTHLLPYPTESQAVTLLVRDCVGVRMK